MIRQWISPFHQQTSLCLSFLVIFWLQQNHWCSIKHKLEWRSMCNMDLFSSFIKCVMLFLYENIQTSWSLNYKWIATLRNIFLARKNFKTWFLIGWHHYPPTNQKSCPKNIVTCLGVLIILGFGINPSPRSDAHGISMSSSLFPYAYRQWATLHSAIDMFRGPGQVPISEVAGDCWCCYTELYYG